MVVDILSQDEYPLGGSRGSLEKATGTSHVWKRKQVGSWCECEECVCGEVKGSLCERFRDWGMRAKLGVARGYIKGAALSSGANDSLGPAMISFSIMFLGPTVRYVT